ncbi:MAG: hypothetical protein IMW83_03825 [Caldanaerobacter subterraneus]|nr:hypothetical protein [Caldanaerobacter subterraneus]
MKRIVALLIIAVLLVGLPACKKPVANNIPKEKQPLVVSENNGNTNTDKEKTKEEKPVQEEQQKEDKNTLKPGVDYPDPTKNVPGPYQVKDKKVFGEPAFESMHMVENVLKSSKLTFSIHPNYIYDSFKLRNLDKLDKEHREDLDEMFNNYIKSRTKPITFTFSTGTSFAVVPKDFKVYTLKEQWFDYKPGEYVVIPENEIKNFASKNIPASNTKEIINTIIPNPILGIRFISDNILYGYPEKTPYLDVNFSKLVLIDELLRYVPYNSPIISYVINKPMAFIIDSTGATGYSGHPFVAKYFTTVILVDENFNPLFYVKLKMEGTDTELKEVARDSNTKQFIEWAEKNLK